MDTPFFQFIPLVKSDSTSPNSDRNQTPFLGKIRPKSDQKSGKNQTLFHNLTTLTLPNVPAGINVPYSYSERIVKYSTFAEKSDFCWPIQTFFGPLFQKKSEFGPSLANSDHNWQHCKIRDFFMYFGPKAYFLTPTTCDAAFVLYTSLCYLPDLWWRHWN